MRNEDVIASTGVSEAEFNAVCDTEFARDRADGAGSTSPLACSEVSGRVTIVVDDGIATGAATRAALRAVRACFPKKLSLRFSVAPDRHTRRRHSRDLARPEFARTSFFGPRARTARSAARVVAPVAIPSSTTIVTRPLTSGHSRPPR